MPKELLFEVGLEEMPAHVVAPALEQLKKKTAAFLEQERIDYTAIEGYATPRRLAISVKGLAEKQADVEEEVKGPAKKIALDAEGNWTKAAEGFVRGQQLTTKDIIFKEINGVEYVHVTKFIAGKNTIEVLSALKEVIMSLTFPVTMHWANYHFEYIRPIHWLVALLDDEVIPFEILDVSTDRKSRGHRFLGHEVTFNHANEYLEKLKEVYVIADQKERREMITSQMAVFAKENNWVITPDEELLEEVENLVEYPTAFVGNFAEKYLAVPEEVLVTSMKEHQRYFEVRDQEGNLLPHFISVRNGNDYKIENVIKGNEKVLVARLEDAEFFYSEDQKLTIAECVEKLKLVTFHEKIGSIYEKMERVGVMTQILGKKIGLTAEELDDVKRAAQIYKFDLVTNMVGEFPELQGIMGEKYALLQGEKPSVAQAIREHYLPIASEGDLPESRIGAVLAIADKLDSILSFFSVNMQPSGSNDPYALRRQSYGIIRIIAKKQWYFPLKTLQEEISKVVNADQTRFGITLGGEEQSVKSFFEGRIRQYLTTLYIRHDIIEAIVNSSQEDLNEWLSASQVLKTRAVEQDFKPSVEAITRVMNLAKKAVDLPVSVNPALFENQVENELYEAVNQVEAKFTESTIDEKFRLLVSLRPFIENYFEHTMVMVDDEAIRHNRLTQLDKIAKLARRIASLDLLVTK